MDVVHDFLGHVLLAAIILGIPVLLVAVLGFMLKRQTAAELHARAEAERRKRSADAVAAHRKAEGEVEVLTRRLASLGVAILPVTAELRDEDVGTLFLQPTVGECRRCSGGWPDQRPVFWIGKVVVYGGTRVRRGVGPTVCLHCGNYWNNDEKGEQTDPFVSRLMQHSSFPRFLEKFEEEHRETIAPVAT